MYRQFNPSQSNGQIRSRGQLQLSVHTRANRLLITVHEARFLQLKPSSSCYVKLYVLPDDNKSTKQKTKVISAKGEPVVFKEDFTYMVPSTDGGGLRLYVSLWRRDRRSRNELIGSLSFSVKEILSQVVKVDEWYHLLTDGEGRRKSIAVQDTTGVGRHSKKSTSGEPPSTASLSHTWLPTKLVVLHWSPSGYGFLLQPGSPMTVSHVEPGLPAQLAGIQQGDILLQVDKSSVVGASYQEVMHQIGSCQSNLQLLIQRPPHVDSVESMERPSKRPPSSESLFSSGSSMLSDPGTLKKRRAESSRDLHSVGWEDENDDYVVTPQKPFRGYISWQDMSPLEQKRQEAIIELVKWEKGYVEDLCFGIERYSKPLREHMLSMKEHMCLFGNMEELYIKASKTLKQLKKRRKPFHRRDAEHPYYLTAIGDIYHEKVRELVSAYMIYLEGRREAEMELSSRRIQPDFVEFLNEPPLNEGQPTIEDFLARPQEYLGILRGFLRKILANTPNYHPDQYELTACIDSLTDTKTSQDEARARVAANEVFHLEKTIGFAPGVERFRLVADGRILVHHGDLQLVEGKKRRLKRVHVLLFNDILLIAKREGTLLVAQETPLDLSCVMVQDFSSVKSTEFCITVIERAAGNRLSMASWKTSHVFQATSVQEKNTWKSLIDERAKGVTTVRRKTNLKQFRTLDVTPKTSPEEDLKQYEREQQLRLADLAPQMYSTLGTRTRVVRGTRWSPSSGEPALSVTSSAEAPSPLRERRSHGPRPWSLFERRVGKPKRPTRRHSLTMADIGELTGTLDRLLSMAHISSDRIERWKTSLEGLIADPDGADLFKTFLQSEFSEENLQFWQSCEELKQLRGQALEHKARQIYAQFLEPDAPSEVNIDAETHKEVTANLASPRPDMFNKAQLVIYTLMERDSYRRFFRSNDFAILEQSASTTQK